jgi:tetratricopeptide (TPR) repeat protein
MVKASWVAALAILGAAAAFPIAALAQEETEKQFGAVHFETSCNEQAQRRFDRAMRYQHSFWYQSSKEIFEDVLKADPECGIAYWGIALSYLYNPHSPPPVPNLPLGLAAIEKGKQVGGKTQRERDYIDALSVMYVDYDKIPHGARVQAYLKAMETLAGRYPEDDEAQIFYAITLNVAASANDKSYANQRRGAAILEPIFKRQPRHPGVAHYLIHLYDTPALAEMGLDAARRYAKIAPAAPHAQHMPSHIFTRVGYWKESIAANIASALAAKASKDGNEQLHAMDYMVYAYLQLGQDQDAQRVVDEMQAVTTISQDRFVSPYALAVSPARLAMERGDWLAASQLEVRPSKFAYSDAMTHFARAIGAAHAGNSEAVRAEVAKIADMREKLRAAKDLYWTEQVDIQHQTATAWALYAEGKYDQALPAMREAADAEDRSEKHPVTPGVPIPARELYGMMLLERGMTAEALAAFEATLKKEPNRLGATIGAAQSAERAADPAKARQYYGAAVALAESADPVRPGIAEARAFLAKN